MVGRILTRIPTYFMGMMSSRRRLVYRYYTLPHTVRYDIAKNLSLLQPMDGTYNESELYTLYFKRAEQLGILDKFWDAVEAAHGVQDRTGNPFTL